MFLAKDSINPKTNSATDTALRPGVYRTGIPFLVAAATSTLALGSFLQHPITSSFEQVSSNSAVIGSNSKMKI